MSRSPDFYSMHARKLLGMPKEWRWFRLEAEDGGAGRRFTKITGAIPAGVITRGPNKGSAKWKGRTQERHVLVSDEEHNAFLAQWERETGSCRDCSGTRLAFAGWSRAEGESTRPCARCAKREQVALAPEE